MGMTSRTVRSSAVPAVEVTLEIPETWISQDTSAMHALVAVRPPEDSGPFADNLTVGTQDVPEGLPADMEAIRATVLSQLHAQVPDMHLIDDRPATVDGTEARFMALLQSDPSGASVIVRQVFGLFHGVLVTVAVTSFPFRDRDASQLAQDILASVTVSRTSEETS